MQTTSHKILDFYKYYKENAKNPVDLKTYRKVIKNFFTEIRNRMIWDNYEFIVPFRLGIISIKRKKAKLKVKDGRIVGLPIDWDKTIKYYMKQFPDKSYTEVKHSLKDIKNLKFFYHENKNTDGYVCKAVYDKTIANYKGKNHRIFVPSRTFNAELNKALKSNKQPTYYDYVEF